MSPNNTPRPYPPKGAFTVKLIKLLLEELVLAVEKFLDVGKSCLQVPATTNVWLPGEAVC